MEKKKMPLPKLDDLFLEHDGDRTIEKIIDINIEEIDEFKNHPFKIIENNEFSLLVESIKENGVILPAIVRLKENGRYEMVSGHRRMYASKLLGLEKIPCVIKDLSDDEATIIMVDSNLQQRKQLLPSEKAFAYKMKYDAMKHQGKRTDLTSGPLDQKTTAEKIGKEAKESEKTVRRYIRLTYLIPKLLKIVDNSELDLSPSMALRPAVEISYLNEKEQQLLFKYIEMNLVTPSLAQAIELKNLSQKGELTHEVLQNIMDKEKPNQVLKFGIPEDKLFNVLPKNIEREKVEDFILKACSYYTKHLKQRDLGR